VALEQVRDIIPSELPEVLDETGIRISATDWAEGGWDVDEAVKLAAKLREAGADLIDCSSGGMVPYQKIPLQPGYQVPFSERIKRETCILTGSLA